MLVSKPFKERLDSLTEPRIGQYVLYNVYKNGKVHLLEASYNQFLEFCIDQLPPGSRERTGNATVSLERLGFLVECVRDEDRFQRDRREYVLTRFGIKEEFKKALFEECDVNPVNSDRATFLFDECVARSEKGDYDSIESMFVSLSALL